MTNGFRVIGFTDYNNQFFPSVLPPKAQKGQHSGFPMMRAHQKYFLIPKRSLSMTLLSLG